MGLVGRRRERREIEELLERAARGSGGVLAIVGPAGSGKTALADLAVGEARERGFEVLRAAPARTRPGRLVWAQLLRDAGASDADAACLLADPGPMELDSAAKQLASGVRRLIVVDDVDHGGQQAIELLSMIAGRVVAGSTAVIVTSTAPIGVGRDRTLRGLTEDELAAVIPDATHALWVASRGLPGVARAMAAELADGGGDPIVQLALRAVSTAGFLVVDVELVRLLELAVSRAADGPTKARVLARLAYELLADATAGARRRELADRALELARQEGDERLLAEVLEARLHALWEPDGVHERLDTGQEIVELARAAGDDALARNGLFWQFIALMELGRVAEAESVLAAYERGAVAAGDGQAIAMATARHGMLAALRGRFEDVLRIADDVLELGRRSGLADDYRLAGTLRVLVMSERDIPEMAEHEQILREWARRIPGHFAEADLARMLALIGRESDAGAELERTLPRVLAGSGPRWIGAMSHLAFAAATTGNLAACADIYRALVGYGGRLTMLAGANSGWGPVDHYLGLLAARLGERDQAVGHFEAAIALEEEIGALPYLAHTLAAYADVVADDTHRRRARSIAERLGMTILLDRLARPADEWTLDRDGDDWLLSAGEETARLRDSRGLHYLRALLAAPGKDIPALDLVAGGAGLVAAGTGPVLDAAARAAYRSRLSTLDAELAGADRTGDAECGARLEAERQAVLDELRRASGLGGRVRQNPAEAERARVNVTRTLRAAMDRIAVSAPRAGAHLHASIRTGLACRYEPAPGGPPRWHG